MVTPSPTPPSYCDDDLTPWLWAICSCVFILLMVRSMHIFITRNSMKRSMYQSQRQCTASYILNALSISTGFVSLASVVLEIRYINVGLCDSGDQSPNDALGVLAIFCFSFQSLCYNLWLVARDRGLQSPFFRTNVYMIYAVVILSLVSAFFNFTVLVSITGIPGTYGKDMEVGQSLQLLIVIIMTGLFAGPLLNYVSGSDAKMSENIRAVVARTAVGAVIHIVAILAFVTLSFTRTTIIASIGYVAWHILVRVGVYIPPMLHVSISHRDDKPVLFALEVVLNLNVNAFEYRSIWHAYRSKTIDTFEAERTQIQSSSEGTMHDSNTRPSCMNSPQREFVKSEIETELNNF